MSEDQQAPGGADAADEAAGYRSVIDRGEAELLAPSDPNVAASSGDCDHENHIGEPVDDDHGLAAEVERLRGA